MPDGLGCSAAFSIPISNDRGKMTAWANYDGASNRKIDYCAISKKSRGRIKKIGNNYDANTRRSMQRRPLRIHIGITLKTGYKTNNNNSNLYDLTDYRNNKSKIKNGIRN